MQKLSLENDYLIYGSLTVLFIVIYQLIIKCDSCSNSKKEDFYNVRVGGSRSDSFSLNNIRSISVTNL